METRPKLHYHLSQFKVTHYQSPLISWQITRWGKAIVPGRCKIRLNWDWHAVVITFSERKYWFFTQPFLFFLNFLNTWRRVFAGPLVLSDLLSTQVSVAFSPTMNQGSLSLSFSASECRRARQLSLAVSRAPCHAGRSARLERCARTLVFRVVNQLPVPREFWGENYRKVEEIEENNRRITMLLDVINRILKRRRFVEF